MATISADEVNYLVYRYLQESGFTHTAFSLSAESRVTQSSVVERAIPPGALISLLQRGLLLAELDAEIERDGELPDYLQEEVDTLRDAGWTGESAPRKRHRPAAAAASAAATQGDASAPSGSSGPAALPAPEVVSPAASSVLRGHMKEVTALAWHPGTLRLISGSADTTARVWPIAAEPSSEAAALRAAAGCVPLAVRPAQGAPAAPEVSAVAWNPKHDVVALGCFDGSLHIWRPSGTLLHSQTRAHEGTVFAVRWSPSGDALLSAASDNECRLWKLRRPDGESAALAASTRYKHHSDPVLDVAWRDEETFASCGGDALAAVCSTRRAEPDRFLRGHTEEVNAVRWCPVGDYLATASDDFTARVWTSDLDEKAATVQELRGHSGQVFALDWAPHPPAPDSDRPIVLATASYDTTVRIWDAPKGTCLSCIAAHSAPIYALAWSPTGAHLVSACAAGTVIVWTVETGTERKRLQGASPCYDAAWSHDGKKIGVAYSTGEVVVFDA